MAIREIKWSVSKDLRSISPNTPQDGGVQGEHNVTKAVFELPEGCPLLEGYTLRFGWVNAAGGYDPTEPLTVEEGKVSFLLPRQWTQYGGTNTLSLVAEKNGEVAYTLDARVFFHSRQTALQEERKMVEVFMQQQCDAAAASAEEAAGSAEEAAGSAEEAKDAADAAARNATTAQNSAQGAAAARTAAEQHAANASTYKNAAAGSAEDAQSAAERAEEAVASLVVDDALSATSTNPVQNKVVRAAIDDASLLANSAITKATAAQKAADVAQRTANQAGETAYNGKQQLDYVFIPRLEDVEHAAAAAVSYTPQTLTDKQKEQARANIGAQAAGVPLGAVRWDMEDQRLQPLYQTFARNNIDAGAEPFVFDVAYQNDGTLTSTATFEDLVSKKYWSPNRPIFCRYEDVWLRLAYYVPGGDFFGFSHTEGLFNWYFEIRKDENGNTEVFEDSRIIGIKVGNVTWGVDNECVDFTPAINGMIAAKMGTVETALDAIIAIQQSLMGGDGV